MFKIKKQLVGALVALVGITQGSLCYSITLPPSTPDGKSCSGCTPGGTWSKSGNPTYTIDKQQKCEVSSYTEKCNYAGENVETAECNCTVATATVLKHKVTGQIGYSLFGYSAAQTTETVTNVSCDAPVELKDFCQRCKIIANFEWLTIDQNYQCTNSNGSYCYTKASFVKIYQGLKCGPVPYAHPLPECNPPPNPKCPSSSGSN